VQDNSKYLQANNRSKDRAQMFNNSRPWT